MKLQLIAFAFLMFGFAFCCYGSITTGFDQKMLEGEWKKKPFFVIRSAASPAWLMRARSDRMLFFNGIGAQGYGAPGSIPTDG